MKNRPTPRKTFKSGGECSRKVSKNSTKLRANRVTHFCALVTNVFLFACKQENCALLPPNVAVLVAIRLRFTVANYSFSTREKNVLYCLKNSNSTICAESCREADLKFFGGVGAVFQKSPHILYLTNFSINLNLS